MMQICLWREEENVVPGKYLEILISSTAAFDRSLNLNCLSGEFN